MAYSDNGTVKDLLCGLLIKNLPVDRLEGQRFIVRRKHVFDDALCRFKSGIDFGKYLKLTFVGEPAAGEGGPLRELFSPPDGQNRNLFCGEEGNRVPQLNAIELKRQTYVRVEEMIASSLVHGGPAPPFFSESVADYIIHGMEKVHVTVDDVPDESVKGKLLKVNCGSLSVCGCVRAWVDGWGGVIMGFMAIKVWDAIML